jgi:predicted enzyme related to lactoylglutathione lyase
MSTATLETKSAKNQNQTACPEPGSFCWNELMTSETGGAAKFYSQLFGWKTEAFSGAEMPYTLFKTNGRQVAGLMARPNPQMPPQWLAYVHVGNVDASTQQARELGAKVCLEPKDIPTVGRIAIIQDPQGASLGLFQPEKH